MFIRTKYNTNIFCFKNTKDFTGCRLDSAVVAVQTEGNYACPG